MSASRTASAHSVRSDRVHHAEKVNRDFWATRSKRFLQAELKRRGVTYAGLAELMTENGLPETEGSITVKINRGGFPTWLFLAALNAIASRKSDLRTCNWKRPTYISFPTTHFDQPVVGSQQHQDVSRVLKRLSQRKNGLTTTEMTPLFLLPGTTAEY
jgi:hypothetical protein